MEFSTLNKNYIYTEGMKTLPSFVARKWRRLKMRAPNMQKSGWITFASTSVISGKHSSDEKSLSFKCCFHDECKTIESTPETFARFQSFSLVLLFVLKIQKDKNTSRKNRTTKLSRKSTAKCCAHICRAQILDEQLRRDGKQHNCWCCVAIIAMACVPLPPPPLAKKFI